MIKSKSTTGHIIYINKDQISDIEFMQGGDGFPKCKLRMANGSRIRIHPTEITNFLFNFEGKI